MPKVIDQVFAINIKDIVIPEGRYRKDLGDIESLAESIDSMGQLMPIIVNEDNVLIAGERRLTAHKYLFDNSNGEKGITIKCIVKKTDEVEHRVLEILENFERKEFTWQEEVKAKSDLHSILSAGNKNWSITKTAEKSGMAKGHYSTDLNIAEALETMPDIFENCKNKAQALKRLQQTMIDETRAEIALRRSTTNYGKKAREVVFRGDCTDLITKLPEKSINAVISDPFYGINISDTKQQDSRAEIYKDSAELYRNTMSAFIKGMDTKVKEDAWVLMFCATEHFEWLREQLGGIGFKCDPMPGIWYRTSSAGQTNTPNYTFGRSYEVFVYGYRGDTALNKVGQSNVLAYSGVPSMDKDHPVEKPLDMMEELVKRFCLPGHVVLDFMSGSGKTLVAAIRCGCIPIGFELDEKYFNIAVENVADALKLKDSGRLDLVETR